MITKSISRRALVLGLLLLALAAAFAAAGLVLMVATRGGDGETDASLTLQEKLLDDLAPQQEDLDFEIIVPSYLPAGTLPVANGVVTYDKLDIYLQVAPDKMAPPDQQAFILISERANTQPHLEPDDFVKMDGRRVGVSRKVGPAGEVWVSLFATLNSVDVTVNVSWRADSSQWTIVLTDGMEQEAVRVFESMLEDATRGGGGKTDNWLTLQEKLLDDLAPVQEELDFGIIVPSYLPAGTLPLANGVVTNGALDIYFQTGSDRTAPPALQAFVHIVEQPATGPRLEPTESVVIDGRRVGVSRETGPGTQVFVTLYTTLKSVDVQVDVSWSADPSQQTIVLTDEMEQEAVKVFESMLED